MVSAVFTAVTHHGKTLFQFQLARFRSTQGWDRAQSPQGRRRKTGQPQDRRETLLFSSPLLLSSSPPLLLSSSPSLLLFLLLFFSFLLLSLSLLFFLMFSFFLFPSFLFLSLSLQSTSRGVRVYRAHSQLQHGEEHTTFWTLKGTRLMAAPTSVSSSALCAQLAPRLHQIDSAQAAQCKAHSPCSVLHQHCFQIGSEDTHFGEPGTGQPVLGFPV